MRGAHHTTVRAVNGRSAVRPGSVLAVRWLFPATDGPVTELSGARVVLGRGEDSGTVLPGSEVSRYHAELVREGPIVVLRDLGSMNGSFVNGLPIKEAPLGPGDVVRLGEWVGVAVELVAAGSAPTPHGTIAPGLFGGGILRAAVEPALRAAKSDLAIIVEGETGTGKEIVARAVHAESGRKGSFLAVNCAALPENLAEAELFGYRAGAFTGAERASPGHFRTAQGGTLLLDEVTDLPAALQAKVLRVIEQREVLPLGESRPVPVDVRIVAASQEALDQAVAAKRFRPDLYARLDGLTVQLPPLRDRIEDVPYLFARLLHTYSDGRPPAVEPRLVEQLCLHDWPFNVRELVTLVRRMLVLHGHEPSLRIEHLPARLRPSTTTGAGAKGGDDGRPGHPAAAPSGPQAAVPSSPHSVQAGGGAGAAATAGAVDRDEADLIQFLGALRAQGGNVSRAAAAVGISRQRAYRLMQGRSDVSLEGIRRADEPQGQSTP